MKLSVDPRRRLGLGATPSWERALSWAALFADGALDDRLGTEPWILRADAPDTIARAFAIAPPRVHLKLDWGYSPATVRAESPPLTVTIRAHPSLPRDCAQFALWHEAAHAAQVHRMGLAPVLDLWKRTTAYFLAENCTRAAQLAYAATPLESEANEVAVRMMDVPLTDPA